MINIRTKTQNFKNFIETMHENLMYLNLKTREDIQF